MLLSKEQRLARDTMRAFAQEKLAPSAARWDRESHFPRKDCYVGSRFSKRSEISITKLPLRLHYVGWCNKSALARFQRR